MKPSTLEAARIIASAEFSKDPAIRSVTIELECGLTVEIDRNFVCRIA